jgi:hypothetical protein
MAVCDRGDRIQSFKKDGTFIKETSSRRHPRERPVWDTRSRRIPNGDTCSSRMARVIAF